MTRDRFAHAVLVQVARATELFGRTGWLGLIMCVVAVIWGIHSWMQHEQSEVAITAEPSAVLVAASQPPARAVAPVETLARQADQALLLTQIQQIAVAQGLAWTAADYKFVPAGDSSPASLEVRCALKGGYPQLRAALAQWLRQVRGLAIRELVFSRSSSEAVEVEAKLQLVVFLRTEPAEVRP